MEQNEPWLADFISSSLTALLRNKREGQPLAEYKYEAAETNLAIREATKPERLIRVLERPSASIRPGNALESTVSDGKHQIQGVFLGEAVTRISQIYEGPVPTSSGTVMLRVHDPVMNITVHCNSPRAELHIEFIEGASINNTGGSLAIGTKVSEDATVQRSLRDYSDFEKEGHARRSATKQRNKIVEDEDDMSVSQLPFGTQVYNATQRSRHDATTTFMTSGVAAFDPTTRSDATVSLAPAQADIRASQDSMIAVEDPKVFVPTASEVPLETTASVAPAPRRDPAINQEEKIEVEKEDGRQPGPRRNAPAGKWESRDLHLLAASIISNDTRGTKAAVPDAPFQRWRQEAQAGRYVPRYIQMIPKDQEQLLTSPDSWQPPLVGRPMRPGQVPISLLQRLTDAADNPDKAAVPPDVQPSSHENECRPTAQSVASKDDLSESEGEEDLVEDPSSSVSWSPSPSPRERKMQLPPNTPPKHLHLPSPTSNRKNCVSQQQGETQSTEVSLPTSNAVFERPHVDSVPAEHKGVDQARNDDEISKGGLRTDVEAQVRDSVGHHVRPSRQSVSEVETGGNDAEEEDGHSVSLTKPHPASSGKTVQVERTPYLAKGLNRKYLRHTLTSSESYEATVDEAQPTSSTFIPSTFSDNSSTDGPIPKEAAGEVAKAASQQNTQKSRTVDTRPVGIVARSQPQTFVATPAPVLHGVENPEPVDNENAPGIQVEEQSNSGGNPKRPDGLAVQGSPGGHLETPAPPKDDIIRARGGEDGVENALLSINLELRRLSERLESYTPPGNTTQREDNLISAAMSDQKQSQPKRKRADVEDVEGQRKRLKRPRSTSNDSVPDQGYGLMEQVLREYRRETLASLSKPRVLQTPAYSSSSRERKSVDQGTAERPMPAEERNITPISVVASQRSPSTPGTRLSTYAEYNKYKSGDISLQQSTRSTPVFRDQELLFSKFKAAYPDYNGTIKDFTSSCNVLSKILASGQGLHPSLFDDAIFHHYHSYCPYLGEEAVNAPVPLSFYDFYHERIAPSHSKRIVTRSDLQKTLARDESVDAASSAVRARYPSLPSTSAVVDREGSRSRRREVSTPQAGTVEQDWHDVDMAEASDEVVEKWRQESARAPSPELGTPDIDRTLSDVPHEKQPPATAPTIMGPPRTTKKRSLPWDAEVTKSKGSARSRTSMSSTPRVVQRTRSSARPFVKPARPTSVKASTSNRATPVSAEVVEKPAQYWTESDTPFKMFKEDYSKLTSVRQEMGTDNGGVEKPRIGGINIYSWRERE